WSDKEKIYLKVPLRCGVQVGLYRFQVQSLVDQLTLASCAEDYVEPQPQIANGDDPRQRTPTVSHGANGDDSFPVWHRGFDFTISAEEAKALVPQLQARLLEPAEVEAAEV